MPCNGLRYYTENVTINNQPYSFIQEGEKQYLLNEVTGKVIKLKEDFLNFKNVGSNFIVAQYYPKKIVEKKTLPAKLKDKNGALLPPPIVMPVVTDYDLKDFAVFNNDTTMQIKLRVKAYVFKQVYLFNENDRQIDMNSNPYGFVASLGDKHTFYNAQLQPVKTFSLKLPIGDYDRRHYEAEELLIKKCKELINPNLVFQFPKHVSVEQSDTDNTVKENTQEIQKQLPELQKTTDNGITEVFIKHPLGYMSKVFATSNDVELDSKENWVTVKSKSKSVESEFKINMQTGKILLPAKYIKLLALKIY